MTKIIKCEGRSIMYTNDDIHFKPRFIVKIKKPKQFSNEIMESLIQLNFTIENVSKRKIELVLPFGWSMMKSDRVFLLYDEKGRERATIDDEEIDIYTRFDFSIIEPVDRTRVYKFRYFNCFITDCGVPVLHIHMSKDVMMDALIEASKANNPDSELVAIYLRECTKFMNSKLPMWQVGSAYWEADDLELVIGEGSY